MYLLFFVELIALVVVLLYPLGNEVLLSVRGNGKILGGPILYSLPKDLAIEDISKIPPAEAVPILMYHGVIVGEQNIGANTSRENFIGQMEMLKQKGYQTISANEYYLFRQGKFVLPSKPIIITFDDGRKDSFYTTDEVLKELGFKATIFLATIKADENEKDPFFLNWDQVREMQATGRWEIEAHGRRSHQDIEIDEKGTIGTYLTSFIYTHGKGPETANEYEKRVEADYVNGISDIKKHLGRDPYFYAIPLNSYGDSAVSNNKNALAFNEDITKRYFKLAFVQAEKLNGKTLESFYNYHDSNPYRLKRLEVENMNPEDLFLALQHFSPTKPALIFPDTNGTKSFLLNTQLLYGKLSMGKEITLSSDEGVPSARMIMGDRGWKNYTIKTRIKRETGRSASLYIYYTDENNYIALDWSEKSLSLIERRDEKERKIASYYPLERSGDVEVSIGVYNGRISVYFGGVTLAQKLPVRVSRGAAGFGVWDPAGARLTIKKIAITPYE